MNARFGIIAGLALTLAACNDGSREDLFVEETTAALDCDGAGCAFSGATKPHDTPKAPQPGGYAGRDGSGGHAGDGGYAGDDDDHDDGDHDSDDDDGHGDGGGHTRADAGAPCGYDDDCAAGEKCERRHGRSYCAPGDDPSCDGYDCDYDRSGSNSGPH